MKKKLILLLLTLTLCSFNLTKVKAETINWKAIRLNQAEKKVYRKYTKTELENNRDAIEEEIAESLRKMYNETEFIYEVSLEGLVTQ